MVKNFHISEKYIELNKLLKASGLCGTGGQAKMMIKDSLVSVDGEIETRVRRKIMPGMQVQVSDQIVKVSVISR